MSDFGSPPVIAGTRWLGICNSVLPVLLIMIIGSTAFPVGNDNGKEVIGRPPGWFFGVMWTLITILWTLALVVSTLWTKSTLMFTLFQVVSFVCVMTLFSWLVLNSNDSGSGATAQVLAVCSYLALSLLIIAVVTGTDDVKTALFLSLSMAPLFSWCSIATLLNFLSIN